VEVQNDADIMGLVGDLLQSPVAYFNGHQAPRFNGVEKKLLQHYVEQGGFIFAEACCGRPEFDEGFRALMRELFPDNRSNGCRRNTPYGCSCPGRARLLPLEGIEYGCKTVVIYSPLDISCQLEAGQYNRARASSPFADGRNIRFTLPV